MTDLEMTRLCAEAIGLIHEVVSDSAYEDPNEYRWVSIPDGTYKPLEDDAQAMALVKKFRVQPQYVGAGNEGLWICNLGGPSFANPDLNRAIVECVAKMQKGKNGS